MSSAQDFSLISLVRLFLLLALVGGPQQALALAIENRAPYPVIVYLKDENFRTLKALQVEAGTTQHYIESDSEKSTSYYNIETYVKDPKDPLLSPTFHHEIKPKGKICVPLNLCLDSKKNKR